MPIRRHYVDTREGQVHYRSSGRKGGVPIVFLHQTASSGAMWEAIMGKLEAEYEMYALDTPGFGGSYDPEDVPSIAYYTDVLMDAVNGIGIADFHVVGHHTGACMAVEMAAGWPDRVKTLSLFGPVQLTREEREEFRKHFSGPIAPTANGDYLLKTWKYISDLGGTENLDLHHREVVDMLRAWRGRAMTYKVVWDQDFPAFYAKTTCPNLIMAARDDVLWPYLDRAKKDHPSAEMVELRGANFEPDLDAPGSARSIRDFLKRHGY